MRQQTFIVAFALLLAISPGTSRGEIVNGSFEDLPEFDGWTDLTGDPLRVMQSNNVLQVSVIDPFEGMWFAEISANVTVDPMTPLLQESFSSFQQVFSAGVGDELAFEHFAYGTAAKAPGLSDATSNAIIELTNLTTDESVQLVDQSAGGVLAQFDTGTEWISVSHTFTEAADYRLMIAVNVTAFAASFAPASAIATLDIDNVRLISPTLISDLTGDGFVDFDDLSVLLANWDADVIRNLGNLVDAEGTPINFDDLAVLLADWTGPDPGGSPTAGDQLATAAVPEPAGVLLAVIGLLGLLGFIRKP